MRLTSLDTIGMRRLICASSSVVTMPSKVLTVSNVIIVTPKKPPKEAIVYSGSWNTSIVPAATPATSPTFGTVIVNVTLPSEVLNRAVSILK